MAEQYTYSTWFFDQQVVYRQSKIGQVAGVLTREVIGAGVLVLGNYNTLTLAQAAIKSMSDRDCEPGARGSPDPPTFTNRSLCYAAACTIRCAVL